MRVFLAYILVLLSVNSFASKIKPVKMGAVAFQHENESLLAVTFQNEKKWHTYWKNPGDAGLEIKVDFQNNGNPITLEAFPWPAPKRYIEQGDMWAYGYSGKYALFYKLPRSYFGKTLKIHGRWLVCKDICIPGEKVINLNINSNGQAEELKIFPLQTLKNIYQNLPQKAQANINLYLTKSSNEDNQLALHYIIENARFDLIKAETNIITPYLSSPLDFKHEEVYLDQKSKTIYGRIYIDWDGIYEEPVWKLPEDGLFKQKIPAKFLLQYPSNEKPKILEFKFHQFTLTGDKKLSELFKGLQPLGSEKKTETKSKTSSPQGILLYFLFAFLGGLILNLMPCVLPVISLKLFGLIIHSNEKKKQVLKHNLFYTFGVLASFLVLGGVVVLLKSGGEKIGWGFQLQSPLFVLFMLILIFLMALNMFGLFEFITPGGKRLGNQELKRGVSADFINGVLATILSTPCSAPFLGTALTFAFTTSHLNIFLIFTFVGLGLAFPFILTGFFPKIIRFLPKPGLWMDKLKKILAISLILTAVWLLDVFFSLVNYADIGIYLSLLLTSIFFIFYLRKFLSKRLIYTILSTILIFVLAQKTILLTLNDNSLNSSAQTTKNWTPWSRKQMEQAKGSYVFVNFTATWCLTCKVNKKLVLETHAFKELAQKHKITLLEGDWTKRDEKITMFLREHNIVGVPAYFLQKPNGEVISLGETISIGKIKNHLN